MKIYARVWYGGKKKEEEMTKVINIKVISEISQEGKKEVIQYKAKGTYVKKRDKIYIKYVEDQLEDMPESKIILVIEEKRITMNRYGTTNSKMIFNVAKKTHTPYKTPYGTFDMTIETDQIIAEIDEEIKGVIKIDYRLKIKNLTDNTTKLTLEIN